MADRSDILKKVRALLDKADSTNFEPEAQALREKADSLMMVHAIESFELERGKDSTVREKPEMREFDYGHFDDRQVLDSVGNVFSSLCRLARCKIGFYGFHNAKVVGFPADLDYLDLLLTSVRIQMSTKMTPRGNPALSYEDNLYVLKSAGFKWQQVYEHLVLIFPERFAAAKVPDETILEMRAAWEARYPDTPFEGGMRFQSSGGRPPYLIFTKGGYFWGDLQKNRKIGVRFTAEYKKHCEENDLPRVKDNPNVYRRSFMQGFESAMSRRISEMLQGQKATADGIPGSGIVLANRDGELLDLLYDLWPEKRPHPADCQCSVHHPPKCSKAPCDRDDCKQYWKSMRAPVRYARAKEVAHSASAIAAGSQAAREMDLSGGRNNLANTQRGIEG